LTKLVRKPPTWRDNANRWRKEDAMAYESPAIYDAGLARDLIQASINSGTDHSPVAPSGQNLPSRLEEE
jgi:hypothetical protein